MHLRIQAYAALVICLLLTPETYGFENKSQPKQLQTGTLGGVPNPDKAALLAMHNGSYILHARGGKMTPVVAEKSRLPQDPKGLHQSMAYGGAAIAPDGAIYVKQPTLMCKSSDGGRTWASYTHGLYDATSYTHFQILKDGTFIAVGIPLGEGERTWRMPAKVWTSSDEARNWQETAEIPWPAKFNGVEYERWNATYSLHILSDGTVLWAAKLFNTVNTTSPPYKKVLALYRSGDEGKSWQGPSAFVDWSSEGGITRTASGKLLATVRYQRPLLSDDPPDLCDGRTWGGCNYSPFMESTPYKHIFQIESHDEGRTWTNFRQLTTTLGQCYGFPAALSHGTVVLVHVTHYGPGPRGSRAMISHDEGQTWEDEVYYLDFSEPSGYNQSLVLEDDTILTISSRNDNEITAIRWKPVKNKEKR